MYGYIANRLHRLHFTTIVYHIASSYVANRHHFTTATFLFQYIMKLVISICILFLEKATSECSCNANYVICLAGSDHLSLQNVGGCLKNRTTVYWLDHRCPQYSELDDKTVICTLSNGAAKKILVSPEIRDHIICIVCREEGGGGKTIYQCRNGHLACATCKVRIQECPLCRNNQRSMRTQLQH